MHSSECCSLIFHCAWLLCSVGVLVEVAESVLVSGENVKVVAVDLDVASDGEVGGRDELLVLVHVLVLSALQELALDDARVLLRRLEDRDSVVRQEEGHDEAAVQVLRDARVELSSEAEDLLVVVNILEEVSLRLVGEQLEDIAQGVHFVAEAVVGRDLHGLGLAGLGVLNLTQVKELVVLLLVEVLGELVDSSDSELSAECVDGALGLDLVAGEVVVSNEVLAWLVHCEALGKLLSLQQQREGVSAVVGVVHFSDLDGIVSQVVVDNEGQVVALDEETEHSAVVVEELLLGGHSASAQSLLQELLHLSVLLGGDLDLRLGEGVHWQLLSLWLALADVLAK